MKIENLKQLNEILSNPTESNLLLTFVEKEITYGGVSGNSYGDDGVQGEHDEYFKLFSIKGVEETLLKVTYQTDSYGDNDDMIKTEFVEAKSKEVQVFEKVEETKFQVPEGKLSFKQIMSVLEEKLEGVSDFAFTDYDKDELGLGEIKPIKEASTGGVGEGEDWNRVFYFVDHDVYINVNGSYSSYNGTDFYDGWDSCSQVYPTVKIIIVYE